LKKRITASATLRESWRSVAEGRSLSNLAAYVLERGLQRSEQG